MAIAEVAYREGEIGILELLDAARTAARAESRRSSWNLTCDCRKSRSSAQWEMSCGHEAAVDHRLRDGRRPELRSNDAGSRPGAEEPEALSVTRWTDKTELFAEYPPLVVGQTSRFAIHLTRLDTFKALTEGSVEVRLRGGSGQPETFRVDAPSRPGIFGVDVKPAQRRTRELVDRPACRAE